MPFVHVLSHASAWAPGMLMLAAMALALCHKGSVATLWRWMLILSGAALAGSVLAAIAAMAGIGRLDHAGWLKASPMGLCMGVLVQLLGTVIAAFSARYLEGEPGQPRYMAALAGVLAAVHVLLLADHWIVLAIAWALVGIALQHLLCFYPDRAFASLAAHKKQMADRVADVLLVGAAALAWLEVGSGSLSALWAYIARDGMSPLLHASAVLLTLAVILRTALLPVHGWLIQVMEAPTPVSALLHAGVVNLGGFVLIRFAPLLENAAAARVVLVVFGLGTAVLAGMVMLTRISIKVRLAWSTVAQMGFMLLECGLGLYTLAALHLVGHSLYKAHVFLSASNAVRQARLQAMHSATPAHSHQPGAGTRRRHGHRAAGAERGGGGALARLVVRRAGTGLGTAALVASGPGQRQDCGLAQPGRAGDGGGPHRSGSCHPPCATGLARCSGARAGVAGTDRTFRPLPLSGTAAEAAPHAADLAQVELCRVLHRRGVHPAGPVHLAHRLDTPCPA